MAEQGWLAGQSEQNRQHLQAVAYSMRGTVSEAQDAVQEAWLPEPMVEDSADDGPEHQAVLADSVGMALLVVLESLRVQAAPQPTVTSPGSAGWWTPSWPPPRGGHFEALLQVLDRDVVFRMDLGPGSRLAHRPLAGAGPV